VTVHRDKCDVHVTVHRDKCDVHVTVHRDKCDVLVTVHLDTCEVHMTVQRDKCDVHVTVHRDKFLVIKSTRCTNFSNLFYNETLPVSDSFFAHHQEFFTVHTAMVYVIQVCWQLARCQQTCMTYTRTIAVRTVKNS
jgi:hypothetical protein